MQEDGMLPLPSIACLLHIIKNLSTEETLCFALRFNAHVCGLGLDAHGLLGDCLLSLLSSIGSVCNAQKVFDKLCRNEFTWTSLMHGYIKCGEPKHALDLFKKMRNDSLDPNGYTFVALVKACAQLKDVEVGRELHAEAARKGLLRTDPFVGSVLVDLYSKLGLLEKAQEVFNMLPKRDLVTWTALIGGFADNGRGEQALELFEQMQFERVSPNAVTFACVLKACGSIGDVNKGERLHHDIVHKGLLKTSRLVGNTLVDMYAKCGMLMKAQKVFDELPVRDVVAWTALIAGYTEHERGEDALKCFGKMKKSGVSPNAFTFSCSLKACGNIGAIEKGTEIHDDILKEGLLQLNQIVGNALVDMYAKCGVLGRAQETFDELPMHDLVSWNALVTGYALLGEYENVIGVFDRMRAECAKPDVVTFVSVLNACSHAGLVERGQAFFEIMCKVYGIIPSLEHYTCIVDLLSRAGQLDKAVAIMKKSQFHPNLVLWLTVLGACRKWENVDIGKEAFEEALLLDEKEDSAYVSMYNIYAHANMLEDANKVETMRILADLQSGDGIL